MPAPLKKEDKKHLVKLGEKINSIRTDKGLTLEGVANKIGKDRQSIHRLEKGQFNPSYIYLMDVCKGLGIEMKELFID